MPRFRIVLVVTVVALLVLAFAAPAGADPVRTIYEKFLGCDGIVSFPCPGPAP